MGKISGLGGIFYKVEDPDRTRAWYQEVLGIGGEWGAHFRWADEPQPDPYSLASPFKASTDYFDPSSSPFMINFRVDDLESFLEQLRSRGIEILGTQNEDYGKFAWILDCDGIKIELWEQVGPSPA